MNFQKRFDEQVSVLNAGEPLKAFDAFYAEDVVMYDNDVVFASNKAEGRAKQLPFFQSAKSIEGCIEMAARREDPSGEASGVAVFRNRSSFVTAEGRLVKIDGLVWQKWQNGQITEERYYRDEMMREKLESGFLAL